MLKGIKYFYIILLYIQSIYSFNIDVFDTRRHLLESSGICLLTNKILVVDNNYPQIPFEIHEYKGLLEEAKRIQNIISINDKFNNTK